MLKILEMLIETEELPQTLSDGVQKSRTQRGASPLHRWWAVQSAILARLATYFAVTERQNPDDELLSELAQPVLSPHAETEIRTQVRDAQWRWLWRQQENAGLNVPDTDVPFSPDDPRVLDPFAGSGIIAAEATRLGCQAHALDLNPLSFQILRAALEFPIVFGRPSTEVAGSSSDGHWNGLADEIIFWARRVHAVAQNRITSLYPPTNGGAGSNPATYLWLHTTTCEQCGATFPVRRRTVVQRGKGGTHALVVEGDADHYQVRLEKIAHPEEDRRTAPCPACNHVNASTIFQTPILAAAVMSKGASLKLVPVSNSEAGILAPWGDSHTDRLASLRGGGLCPELDRDLSDTVYESPIRHGAKTYADLFSRRQLLAGLEFLAAIKEVKTEMQVASLTEPHISAITAYLSFLLGHIVERNSLACSWHHTPPHRVRTTFDRVAFSMPALFAEQVPSQLIETWCDGILHRIRHAQSLRRPSQVALGSATRLPYPDEFFDAIVTDPPFFDRIPYAELADFYVVWERRLWSNAVPPDNTEAVISASAGALPEFNAHFREAVLEIFRVLKQGRGFTMLLTSRIKEHFEAYIGTAQECGFELLTVKSITEQHQFDKAKATVTAIASFRKPFRNTRHTILAVDAEVTLKAAEQNKPVLYAALADLLISELDERDLADFIPATAKGTKTEVLMEVLADLDPRQLLRETLGRSGIRRISERLEIGTKDEPAEMLVDALLRHFGFTIPVSTDESNPTLILDKLNKLQSQIHQAREKADLRGSFLEVATLIERMLKLAVFGWARVLFGDDWREVLTGLLPPGHRGLDKVTFGDLISLFRAVPDRGAEVVAKGKLLGKVGTPHVYRPKRYLERLEGIVSFRNKVEHDRDGFWSGGSFTAVATDIRSIADQALRIAGDFLADRVVPRIARAKRESRDEWNRTTYTFLLDDGSEKEVSLSHPLKLGENYLYFGTATNPRPVDPIVIPLHE